MSFAPVFASTSSNVRSASRTPVHAAATIARSSRRRGVKMPGVSTSSTWLAPRIMIPRTRNRVVCAFGVTIDSFAPASRLTSVDLPAFGAPTTATKPHASLPPGSTRGHAPSTRSRSLAASCSAARLLPAVPEPVNPPAVTVTTNSGACGGPTRDATV